MKTLRWYRTNNGVIAGVCDGLSQSLDIPVGWIRIFFAVFTLIGGGGILSYIALAVSLPSQSKIDSANEPKILGVCLFLSQRLEIEIGIVRFLAILTAAISFGITIIAYIAAYFLFPSLFPRKNDFKDIN